MQAYLLAHKARAKLSLELSRHDNNLQRLVGHANLLDSIMLHLDKTEQELWLNEYTLITPSSNNGIQRQDAMIEELEQNSSAVIDLF